MSWSEFPWFAAPAALLWLAAGCAALKRPGSRWVDVCMLSGVVVFGAFIIALWAGLGRPPLRTMGETRLWYAFFLPLLGYLTYKRWGYAWLPLVTGLIACVFAGVNLARPEIHSAALMPALQSWLFVPHVVVYILSYAMLGVATIAAGAQLFAMRKGREDTALYGVIDNIVYAGFGFLMLGMLTGAFWAKEAWGHYWSWDPKETWAFITAAAYLAYIHIRLRGRFAKAALWLLPAAFVLLMITWIGVSYLPAAQNSVHVYS